jgi:hypothetical protein
MADDVVTPSNLPVVLIEEEELEEPLFDMNVFKQPCDEELFQRMVHTRLNCSMWDHRSSPNPQVLTIYLEFVPTHGATPKRFEECQCEDDDVRLHYRTWVSSDGHYRWL